jgi:hypothetical protein
MQRSRADPQGTMASTYGRSLESQILGDETGSTPRLRDSRPSFGANSAKWKWEVQTLGVAFEDVFGRTFLDFTRFLKTSAAKVASPSASTWVEPND